jgi:hypothetical protein
MPREASPASSVHDPYAQDLRAASSKMLEIFMSVIVKQSKSTSGGREKRNGLSTASD